MNRVEMSRCTIYLYLECTCKLLLRFFVCYHVVLFRKIRNFVQSGRELRRRVVFARIENKSRITYSTLFCRNTRTSPFEYNAFFRIGAVIRRGRVSRRGFVLAALLRAVSVSLCGECPTVPQFRFVNHRRPR